MVVTVGGGGEGCGEGGDGLDERATCNGLKENADLRHSCVHRHGILRHWVTADVHVNSALLLTDWLFVVAFSTCCNSVSI